MSTINEDFYFNPKSKITSSTVNEALSKFANEFDTAVKLDGNYPIFLDTNILLGYYGMSKKEKKNLLAFLEKYEKRIYISRQIEHEYLKNRLKLIRTEFFEPLNEVSEDFTKLRTEIGNKLKEYIAKRKNLLINDYPESWKELSSIQDAINKKLFDSTYLKDISNEIQNTTQNFKNIEYVDELLEKITRLNTTTELLDSEITFLQKNSRNYSLITRKPINMKNLDAVYLDVEIKKMTHPGITSFSMNYLNSLKKNRHPASFLLRT